MILKELKLDNIRSHKNSEIAFEDGINIITGNTGSGKSSILMAVQYALFGKIGEGREEGRLLLRRGSTKGVITLKFSDGGSEYYIKRGLKKVKETVRNDDEQNEIRKDGRLIDLQNRAMDLNNYVLKLLKIESSNPIKTFETITYIKQDELKDLIFDTGQDKQQYIDQLLQLNKYADAFDRLKEVIDKIRNEIEINRIEATLSIDENELIKIESRIKELESLNSEATKKVVELDNQINNNKVRLTGLEGEIKFYTDLRDQSIRLNVERTGHINAINKLDKNIASLEAEVATKESTIRKVDDLVLSEFKKAKTKNETLLNEINVKQRLSYEALYRSGSELKSESDKIAELGKNIKTLGEINENLTVGISALKGLIEKSWTGLSKEELTGRVAEMVNFISELKTEKVKALETNVCQTCGESFSDSKHLEREYAAKINKYENLISDMETEIKKTLLGKTKRDLEREYDKLSIEIESNKEKLKAYQLELNKIDITEINKKTESLRNENNKLLEETSKIKNEINRLNNEITNTELIKTKIDEIALSRSKLKDLGLELQKDREELGITEEKIGALDFDVKSLETKNSEARSISGVISELSSMVSGIKSGTETRNSEISENHHKLEEFKTRIEKRKTILEAINKKEKFLILMENLRKDIRDIREYVRNRFIKDFKMLFQARFAEIRNESDYATEIDNDYNVKVIANDEILDAKTLSGGEKTSVALAYRMALSSIASLLGGVSKNESLLMDEPTSGLDKEDINALSTCITRINDINQIVIVTHEDTMKNIADRLITITKTAGESKVN